MVHHRRPSRKNPWLPVLLLAAGVLVVLSCALHVTADCSTAIGTNEEQEQTASEKGGDCHGRNHTHSHGHHGGGDSGRKDKPGPPAATASSNPWVLTAGAAPRLQLVAGFTAATGIVVVVIVTGATVFWSLATY